MQELGGFAENEDAIDGTKEDFYAFNYCLANDYYVAIVSEDFESIVGDTDKYLIDIDLIDDICKWLNYDGEIGKDIEDDIEKIKDGTIITCNNRTFYEACKKQGLTSLTRDYENRINSKMKIKKRK